MLKKLITITCLALLFSSFSFAEKVNVKRLAESDWIIFETENFNILTDTEEERARELVHELENFKHFLSFILTFTQKPFPQKITVIAAKDIRTFKATGIPGTYAGIFTKGYGYSIFAQCDGFRPSSHSKTQYGRRTLFHELVHLFIHNSFSEPVIHPWFDEGMAQYFSTFTEENGRVIIGNMNAHKNRYNSIMEMCREHDNIDTESLFKTTVSELNIFNIKKRHGKFLDKFYARALITVHYMLSDNKRSDEFIQYLDFINNGVLIDKSFELAFKISFRELDNKINRYISEGKIGASRVNPGNDTLIFPDVNFIKHKVTKHDALSFLFLNIAVLPEKFLSNKNLNKMIRDIEKLYPDLVSDTLRHQVLEHSEDMYSLSRAANIYGKIKKYNKAVGLYEKALSVGAPDAFLLNNYAWLLVTMDDISMRNPERAIELADKAVSMEKTPDRLDTLAEAYYVKGSFQRAVETINEAFSMETGDIAYLKKQRRKFKKAVY